MVRSKAAKQQYHVDLLPRPAMLSIWMRTQETIPNSCPPAESSPPAPTRISGGMIGPIYHPLAATATARSAGDF